MIKKLNGFLSIELALMIFIVILTSICLSTFYINSIKTYGQSTKRYKAILFASSCIERLMIYKHVDNLEEICNDQSEFKIKYKLIPSEFADFYNLKLIVYWYEENVKKEITFITGILLNA